MPIKLADDAICEADEEGYRRCDQPTLMPTMRAIMPNPELDDIDRRIIDP